MKATSFWAVTMVKRPPGDSLRWSGGRLPIRLRSAPAGQENCLWVEIHPDPVHLQYRQIQGMDAQASDRGLTKRFIMAGMRCLQFVEAAGAAEKQGAGMDVPDEIIQRAGGRGKKAPGGRRHQDLCGALSRNSLEAPGIAGFHIMAIEWEEKVPEIVEKSGLYPRLEV